MKFHSISQIIIFFCLLELIKSIDSSTFSNYKSIHKLRKIEESENISEITSIDLKNENECSFLPFQKELEITAEGYKDSDLIIDFDGVELISENNENEIELQCHIDRNKKYCKKKDGEKNPKSGNYHLNIPNDIRNQSYIIKEFNGKNTIQIYDKESKVEVKSPQNYNIDYNNKKYELIEILFGTTPDENIKAMKDEKEVECQLKRTIMGCKIDNNTFSYDIENPDQYKEYDLKIVDSCNTELYPIKLNVKNTSAIENNSTNSTNSAKEEDNKKKVGTGEVIFIIFSALFFLAVVGFLVFTIISSKKQKQLEVNISENNLK